jgi:hypothetical protein
MSTQREYIVTLRNFEDLENFYNDMETPSESLYIPSRAVTVHDRRKFSCNTHYYLTDDEAVTLRNDHRVLNVLLSPRELNLEVIPTYTQNSDHWSRSGTFASNLEKNWGLLRGSLGSQIPGWGTSFQTTSSSITVPFDGEHVDVVIVDGLFDPTHPEFTTSPTGTGLSRVYQYNWFELNPDLGLGPTGTYSYSSSLLANKGHGIHVAGIAVGNTHGWAKNANIYNIGPYGENGVSTEKVLDYVKLWHNNKEINPLTGRKNPTILNLSIAYIRTEPISNITSVVLDGVTYPGPFTFTELINLGIRVVVIGTIYYVQTLIPLDYFESDILQCINDGIIVVGAAGNYGSKITRNPSDISYNNRYYVSYSADPFYLNRGSFTAGHNAICVGNVDSVDPERKYIDSQCGPRVDVYAPGTRITSAYVSGTADPRNGLYSINKLTGTSMASPQVTGLLACIMSQLYDLTQAQAVAYIHNFSKTGQLINDTLGGSLFSYNLQGSTNRYLYAELDIILSTTVTYPVKNFVTNIPITPFAPVAVTGGLNPFTFSISPSLPTGLLFNTSTGEISGTPTSSINPTTFTITITDNIGRSKTETFTLTVELATYQQVFTINPNAPIWVTPKGFLFTGTELTFNSYTITATNTSSYLLLNGTLPNGLTLSTTTGVISGTPSAVSNVTSSKFTVRAYNTQASVDRTFLIDIRGSDLPIWNTITITTSSVTTLSTSTTQGYLPLGLQQQPYALNRQYIDFQFVANAVESPSNTKIRYYIPDQGGTLPPNLTLSEDGRLTGILDCFGASDAITILNNTIIVYQPKEYQFYISATDSVRFQERLFKILVVDPEMLRYPSLIASTNFNILNISLQTQPFNYLQPPQFLQDQNLGTLRSENFHTITASAYNPAPLVGTLTYSLITGTTVYTNLPNELKLDTSNGIISGYVPYQPAYTKSYQFTVNARKTDGNITTSTRKTFNLAIKGIVESTIEWVSTSSIGSIYGGQISELTVKARQVSSDYAIKYIQTGGLLPAGLTLKNDGTIVGKTNYNTSGTYQFTVIAKDVYELSAIEKTFSLTVIPSLKEYNEVYLKSLLSKEKLKSYSDFLDDETIFNPKLMYRYFDSNFGIQRIPKIVLEFGLERIALKDFYPSLNNNFYRRKFYFGDIKIAEAKDNNGQILYELIYADVIDILGLNNKSVDLTFTLNSSTYYPASIDNMRYRLQNISVNNSATITVNTEYNPKFFKSFPQVNEDSISYVKFIPICYTLPGQGNKILNKINISNFDFKQYYIEADRLIVGGTNSDLAEKYVFFPKKNIRY